MYPRILIVTLAAMALAPLAAEAQDGWLLFRGNAQRTGAAAAFLAWEKPTGWKRPLLLDKLDGFDDADADQGAKDLIDMLRKGADRSILPGSFPLIVNNVCIYRSYRDIRSATLREFQWVNKETGIAEIFKPRAIVWKSIPHHSSLANLLEKSNTKMHVPKMVGFLKASKQEHWVWANPLIGSLSSDGRWVFGIGDFAFPNVEGEKGLGDFMALSIENALYAYDALIGKLIWDSSDYFDRKSLFANTYFLGAPLLLDGKLYALNEKADDLRLFVGDLDRKKWKNGIQLPFEKPVVLTKIPTAEQVRRHPLRRTQPLHLAHADGLLVCPTHAGVLLGIDRGKLTERWHYRYRDEKTEPAKSAHWQAAGPIIHQDRIVFTAADAPGIHCIDLDGKKKWTVPGDNDLYLATVHDNLVLLVGKSHCRALALADGTEKWKLELGSPAGVGVKDGSLYYLPVKESATIWAINLAKGTKAHHLKTPYPDALGNLALHRGMLVSQSATHIAAFPLGIAK